MDDFGQFAEEPINRFPRRMQKHVAHAGNEAVVYSGTCTLQLCNYLVLHSAWLLVYTAWLQGYRAKKTGRHFSSERHARDVVVSISNDFRLNWMSPAAAATDDDCVTVIVTNVAWYWLSQHQQLSTDAWLQFCSPQLHTSIAKQVNVWSTLVTVPLPSSLDHSGTRVAYRELGITALYLNNSQTI